MCLLINGEFCMHKCLLTKVHMDMNQSQYLHAVSSQFILFTELRIEYANNYIGA